VTNTKYAVNFKYYSRINKIIAYAFKEDPSWDGDYYSYGEEVPVDVEVSLIRCKLCNGIIKFKLQEGISYHILMKKKLCT